MARPVTISAIQPSWPTADLDLAARKEFHLCAAYEGLEEAARRKSDIACLPETFSDASCSLTLETIPLLVEHLDGPVVMALRDIARRSRMHIVAPLHRWDGGLIRNSAIIIDRDGEIAGIYDKVHPTRSEIARGITPGDGFPVFHLDFGTIGVQICHDNSFVESARCLALNGAEIIFWPHVQSGWGDIVWDITLRSRAIDNGVYVVSSCFAVRGEGAWKPGMMMGRSGIVGQDGFILAEMAREPGVATTTVDLDRQRLVHSWSVDGELPFVSELRIDRRPDQYGAITELKVEG